jgi:uncharacterized phage-associated protein
MSAGPPYDPRSIANLLLDQADALGYRLTNLALQKLLYFAYARFLIKHDRALVSGFFAAWKFGPVHPAVYKAFKVAGAQAIDFRAQRLDLVTGTTSPIPLPQSLDVRRLVGQVVSLLGRMEPGRLVDLAHAKNAPWDIVVNKSGTALAFGGRIPDNVIRDHFKHHKVAIGDEPIHGDPCEEVPFLAST